MLYMVQHFSYEVHYETMNQIFQTSIQFHDLVTLSMLNMSIHSYYNQHRDDNTTTVPKVTYCLIFFSFYFSSFKTLITSFLTVSSLQ